MHSPNNIASSGKAASIRSFDSGYASGTLEDEVKSSSYSTMAHSMNKQLLGLGISGIEDFQANDKLRYEPPKTPVDAITTRLNVHTTRNRTTNNTTHCLTCQLWQITKTGRRPACITCNSISESGSPEACQNVRSKVKATHVPRLDIPHTPLSNPPRTLPQSFQSPQSVDSRASPVQPSWSLDPNFLSPISPIEPSTVRRSCARRSNKLPPQVVTHLRTWLDANQANPYPSPETKRTLAQDCGITEKQVTTWFTNTRARKLAPSNEHSHSTSEDENIYESDFSSMTNTPIGQQLPVFTSQGFPMMFTPVSVAPKVETTDPLSIQTQTSRRGKKKDYRRMNTISPTDESPIPRTPVTPSPNAENVVQKTWQCTFCHQHLVPKSWRRHEETQHRPKHQWTCLATSPRLQIPSRNGPTTICAFCEAQDPSEEHFLQAHRIVECSKKNEADRTFGRPDHLRQHIKNFHKTPLSEHVRDTWRRDGPGKNESEGWTCGFCAAPLMTWDIRESHIANHFKQGCTMATWNSANAPSSSSAMGIENGESSHHAPNMIMKTRRRFTERSRDQAQLAPVTTFDFSANILPTDIPTTQATIPQYMYDVNMPMGSNDVFSTCSAYLSGIDALSPTTMGIPYDPFVPSDPLPEIDPSTLAAIYGNPIDYQGIWEPPNM